MSDIVKEAETVLKSELGSPGLKTKIAKVAVVVALVVGGYAFGRYAQPAKVVVTEKVVSVDKVQTVTTVDTDKILNAISDVKKTVNVHRVRVTQKKPDGTVTTTDTTDAQSATDTKTQAQDQEQTKAQQVKTQVVYQDREVTKTVINQTRPSWSFELSPGIDFAALAGRTTYSLLPSTGDPLLRYTVIGLSIQKRLIGPVYGGVWANTSGAGGLTLRLDL